MRTTQEVSRQGVRRRQAVAGALAGGLLATLGAAQAENFPVRPVRIVVPSSPGGSLDAVARILALRLGEIWKQPVVVENKPGANFAIGAAYVAKAPADGYTLLYAHDGTLAMNPVLYPRLPYDPLKELTAVGRAVDLPLVMYVRSALPYTNLAEFLQAMRADPGKFNHASGGTATMMSSELFKSVAGVQYVDVSYKGGGPAMLAVAAGEADFSFADPGSAAALLQSQRIRPLATASPRRLRLQPGLPSISETVPGYATASWSGLHAPAGTPAAIVRQINKDMNAVLAEAGVRSRLEDLGVEVHPSSPGELDALIRADTAKWAKLVKDKNIQLP